MDIGRGSLEEEEEGHVQASNTFATEVGGGRGLEWQEIFGGTENIYEEDGVCDVENEGGNLDNRGGIKYVYHDKTWKQEHFTYDPKPQESIEVSKPTTRWNQFSTMLQLLELFWSFYILRDIVNETNRYVTLCNRDGVIPRGTDWELFTIAEFKAWLAIWLYMGMKRQPNMKSYWMKEGLVFHCLIISRVMLWNRFNALIRCFLYYKSRNICE
jgi:hypothetical protein